MKRRAIIPVLAAIALIGAFPGNANARVIVGLGFNFGFPLYWPVPYYYAPPVYYAPPPVYYAPAPAPVPAQQTAAPAAESWWYYCASAKGYYPYVRDCPGGWQRVSPTPQQ